VGFAAQRILFTPARLRRKASARLDRILRRVDLVKTSTEDLTYLFPGQDTEHAAAELLARGPGCVVVTDDAAD
jgi:sugar/nucleoside kinase (ribokinase family)